MTKFSPKLLVLKKIGETLFSSIFKTQRSPLVLKIKIKIIFPFFHSYLCSIAHYNFHPKKHLVLIGHMFKNNFPTDQNWGKTVPKINLCQNVEFFSPKMLILQNLVKLCFLQFSKPKELCILFF